MVAIMSARVFRTAEALADGYQRGTLAALFFGSLCFYIQTVRSYVHTYT
jgi:hypothetical protein